MGRTTFLLIAFLYYAISIGIVALVLYLLKRNENKKIKKEIEELETEKNLVISASMLSELNKVKAIIKKLQPNAEIIETNYGKVDTNKILNTIVIFFYL